MVNILDIITEEKKDSSRHVDEYVFATLRVASFCYSIREIESRAECEKDFLRADNKWIIQAADNIPAILFDNVKNLIDSDRKSVDAFLYHFSNSEKLNYLIEFKKDSKENVIKMLCNGKDDAICKKYKDSALLIRKELIFGGALEKKDLISKTHVIIVYYGKNDTVSEIGPIVPRGAKVERDSKGKQKKASKMNYKLGKKAVYSKTDLFGDIIEKLGYALCEEKQFSVPAEPKVNKEKGKGKVRKFSMFSASDFNTLIMNGDFNNWDWGDYQA